MATFPPRPPHFQIGYAVPALLIACLCVTVCIVWGGRHYNDTLFMALCGGRDAFTGAMGLPDQWSFKTEGRTWVDQGWLSGLVLYLSYLYLQEWGPFLLKGTLIVAGVPLLYLRCRRLGTSTIAGLGALILGLHAVSAFTAIRSENFACLLLLILTTLITAGPKRGPYVQAGCLLVMALWSNTHGSFPLGFMILGMKVALEAVWYVADRRSSLRQPHFPQPGRTPKDSERDRTQPGKNEGQGLHTSYGFSSTAGRNLTAWFATWLLCVPIAAFANPFGSANLAMPFHQAGSEYWTDQVAWWAPLITLDEAGGFRLYGGQAGIPFVLLTFMMLFFALSTWVRGGLSALLPSTDDPDGTKGRRLALEAVVSLAMLTITLRFGRTVLFTGLTVIPTLAYLAGAWVAALRSNRGSGPRSGASHAAGVSPWSVIPATMALIGLSLFFWAHTIRPYTAQAFGAEGYSPAGYVMGPLASQLRGISNFLGHNQIGGRVFATWTAAAALRFYVPNIQVFLDVRCQSIYPDIVKREYDAVIHVTPRAFDLLDDNEVSAVVLTRVPSHGRLIDALMRSPTWRIAYLDAFGAVFLRHDSSKLECLGEIQGPDCLWYPDNGIRTLVASLFQLQTVGKSAPELDRELRQAAREQPSDIMFQTIYAARKDERGCLDEETKAYFKSQLLRLSDTDLTPSTGALSRVSAMATILGVLEFNGRTCSDGTDADHYGRLKAEAVRLERLIRRQMLPWGSKEW
ncbi:MAG: hypothetical protein V2B18_17670, partial [Pseudomonadota bacterium]